MGKIFNESHRDIVWSAGEISMTVFVNKIIHLMVARREECPWSIYNTLWLKTIPYYIVTEICKFRLSCLRTFKELSVPSRQCRCNFYGYSNYQGCRDTVQWWKTVIPLGTMIPSFIATHALFKTIYLLSATEAFGREEQYVYCTSGVTKDTW